MGLNSAISRRIRPVFYSVTVLLTVAGPSVAQPAGWQVKGDRLECTYQLKDFVESVAFVEQLVEPSEALRHHPDVAIAYNRVSLSLTTHDADGLTELDFKLAREIDRIANRQSPPIGCSREPN